MNREECIYSIALTLVPGIGVVKARYLLDKTDSATDLAEVKNCPQAIVRAEKEYGFLEKKGINCLTIKDEAYPSRLRECDDAPVVLFYKGKADLNNLRIINMVGTRNATDYGKQLCSQFLKSLKELCPGVLVVSGLAYGIDIHAHRTALENGLPTVAVLAHGLDRVYPTEHRKTAIEMLAEGGLITEFLSETNPDRYNFVSRNRIIAGMSDATIVVESGTKGGSLITADIANGYHRDCFAFPGRTTDEYSLGCNCLIRDHKASLILSAEDFVGLMGWGGKPSKAQPVTVQRRLFPDLTEDEQVVVSILAEKGDLQINALVVEANIPIHKMSAILFEMEMKGVVRTLAGGVYQLLS